MLEKHKAELKKMRNARGVEAARGRDESLEVCKDSPWLEKEVRVIAECLHEGRRGKVRDVWRVEGSEGEFRFRVLEVETASIFQISSSQVVAEDKNWKPPKPDKLDWRTCKVPRRTLLAKEFAIMNTEMVQKEELIELGTLHAVLGEIEERVGLPDGVVVVEPTVAVAWAREGQGEDAPTDEQQVQQQLWAEKIDQATHLLIAVHSEAPSHYTYLRVSKQGSGYEVEYRDSLKIPSDSAAAAATRILRKLEALAPGEVCPPRSNERFQIDGWSCGLWVARWVERALRELRGEGRQAPISIGISLSRANEFIRKLKDASDNPAAKAKAKAKAKGAKASKEEGPLAEEPKHASLDEALEAAKACSKCEIKKDGSKGCRGCMGEHFEAVRLKGFAARALKDATTKKR